MSIKARTYIDSTLYEDPTDLFRKAIKKYWHISGGELAFNGSDATGAPILGGDYSIIGSPYAPQYDISGHVIKRVIVGESAERTEPLWMNYRLSVKIIGDNSDGLIEDDDAWRDIVLSNIEAGTEYSDHVFGIDLPLNNRESQAVKASAGQLAGDVEYVYNYYQAGYEEYTQGYVSERVLPNMYAFVSALMASDDTIEAGSGEIRRGTGLGYFNDSIFIDHLTLNGVISTSFIYALRIDQEIMPDGTSGDYYLTKGEFFSMKEYMRKFAIASATEATRLLTNRLDSRFYNLLYPVGAYKSLVNYNDHAVLFPFYARISFGTEETVVKDSEMWSADVTTGESSQLKDLFVETNLFSSFMKDMLETFFQESPDELPVRETPFTEVFTRPVLASDDTLEQFAISDRDAALRTIDLTSWWQDFYNRGTGEFNAESVMFGNMSMETRLAMSADYEVYKNMLMIIFAAKLRDIISQRHRKYHDILNGAPAYAETVMYRIAKFEGRLTESQAATRTPIQNFWVPDTNETELVDIIDTQVKFDKNYTYIVYAYKIVIGSKYGYESIATSRVVSRTDPERTEAGLPPRLCVELVDVDTEEIVEQRLPYNFSETDTRTRTTTYFYTDEQNEFIAEFNVVLSPSIQIFEVPYMVSKGAIVDSLPLAPDVTIYPYRGKSNVIKLFMKGAIGEISLEPIVLEQSDSDVILRFKTARSVSRNTNEILYKSDDHPKAFEIYRTTVRPTRPDYSDFVGKLHKTISTNWQNTGEVQYSSAIDYDDKIVANRKYYYVVRSIDIHDNPGYPSPVYEVELVDDGVSIFPLIDVIELEIPDGRTYKKSAKRLIKIKPTFSQVVMDEYSSRFYEIESAKELIINNDPPDIDLKLGVAEDPIWDQKFKLRLTSKDTGRKIDINFEFKKQHVVTQFENT